MTMPSTDLSGETSLFGYISFCSLENGKLALEF